MEHINKLTYVSYDGFMEMDNLRNNYDSILELDCKDITTEDKFLVLFRIIILTFLHGLIIGLLFPIG